MNKYFPILSNPNIVGLRVVPQLLFSNMIEKLQDGRQEKFSVVMRQDTVKFPLCEAVNLCSYDHSRRGVRMIGYDMDNK